MLDARDRRRSGERRPVILPGDPPRGVWAVKKLLVVVVAGLAGFALWRKVEADKAEQALWAEVTDPVK
jgi:hypothetical protein